MRYAQITGWGKYAPPLVMTNDDMAKIVDTSDEWIFSRSGIRQRQYSHVSTGEMGWLSAERALATAGVDADDIDLIILGSTTPEEICPNTASYIKNKLGAKNAAAFDLNSACTSWFYALNTATDMVKSGSINKALVIGSERLSLAMDWQKRESCFLFGDGAGSVVIEAAEQEGGLLAGKMSCVPDSRECLRLPNWGMSPAHLTGDLYISLDFDGAEIFKSAVKGMSDAISDVLQKQGLTAADIDLFVPHQANIRIMQSTARKLKMPMEKVIVTVDQHGNTSAASIPLALDHGVRSGQITKGQTLMLEGVGGGFTWGSVLLKY